MNTEEIKMRTRRVFGGAWGPSITLDFSEEYCTITYTKDDTKFPITLDREDVQAILRLMKFFTEEEEHEIL